MNDTVQANAPIHEQLGRKYAAGFITGLTPPQQPLGPMHELTQLLANAFSSPPRGTPPRNAPP